MTKNVFILLLLAVLLTACEGFGLGGEPDIIATFPPPTNAPISNDLGYPETPPDLALGAVLYAANCTDCHGENGAGDGELVQSGQVMNPGNFTDPAQIAGKAPVDYFDIITNGNLENLMPPWRDALTESERWAVALYTYTLHYNAEQLALGEDIYVGECAQCHGETGLGDGPQADAARGVGNLADPEPMVFISDDNIYTLVAEGAGAAMPAYQDVLTEDEMRAVVAYTRSLALQNINAVTTGVPVAQAEATDDPQPTPVGETVVTTVSGEVTNGTQGATVPDDLIVTLRSFDAEMNEATVDTTVQDGRYTFEDVTLQPGFLYFVSTEYAGQSYGTQSFNSNTPDTAENLPLLIYEPTDDPGVITIDQMITEILPAGEVLEIRQDVTFTNTSDRLFIGQPRDTAETEGERQTFTLPLPVGAVMALLPQSGRYVYDDQSFVLSDTRAILPGQSQIRFVYLLPYGDGAVIEYPVEHAVSGPVLLLLAGEELQFESDQFQAIDPSVAPDADVRPFGANVSLNPGELIRYELLGRAPGVGTSQDSGVITSDNLVPILIGAFGVLLAAIGGLIYFNVRGGRKQTASGDLRINQLVSQIADLDAQHDAGQINHDLYHQRRTELKAELSELMNERNNA